MICVTVFGVIGNILVVTLFTKHKCLRSRTTKLLSSLAVSDGTMALIGGGMFSINLFAHRQAFGLYGQYKYPHLFNSQHVQFYW